MDDPYTLSPSDPPCFYPQQSFNGKMIHMLEIVDNNIDFIHEDAFEGLDGLLFLKISSPTLAADPTSSDSHKITIFTLVFYKLTRAQIETDRCFCLLEIV